MSSEHLGILLTSTTATKTANSLLGFGAPSLYFHGRVLYLPPLWMKLASVALACVLASATADELAARARMGSGIADMTLQESLQEKSGTTRGNTLRKVTQQAAPGRTTQQVDLAATLCPYPTVAAVYKFG